jgi:hypothetical protein
VWLCSRLEIILWAALWGPRAGARIQTKANHRSTPQNLWNESVATSSIGLVWLKSWIGMTCWQNLSDEGFSCRKAAISVFKERVKIWIDHAMNRGLCARLDVTCGWWIILGVRLRPKRDAKVGGA